MSQEIRPNPTRELLRPEMPPGLSGKSSEYFSTKKEEEDFKRLIKKRTGNYEDIQKNFKILRAKNSSNAMKSEKK